jgi:uncharacterized protein (TIGR02246 family)
MTACVRPQVDIEAERAAIAARGKALVAAEAALDTQGALAFWAADGILMGHGVPIVQGRAELENALNGFFRAVVEFGSTTTRIVVAASGDMAWEYGINRAVVPGPKGNLLDMGKYAAVWKKIDGEWYITLVAYSSDALAPAPM